MQRVRYTRNTKLDCLVYCSKDGNIKVFENEINGIITDNVKSETGSMIDRLVIPDSLNCTIAELNHEEAIEFWSKNSNFSKFKEWVEKDVY